MANNYYLVPAEGQLDNMACWAACLKWWFRAAKSVKKSQRKLIDKYNFLTDEWGAMTNNAMEQLIALNGMRKQVYYDARYFTVGELNRHLVKGPVYVAFTERSSSGRHVNVIHGVGTSLHDPQVAVMEPQDDELPDLTYRGSHLIKPLSEFNSIGTVIVGSLA